MQPKLSSLQYVGDTYRGFRVTKSMPIPELKCHLRELVHINSGAQVMHIANDDVENLFCLSFRTIPASSNGVAHILEHTVLCGSKKFPVKDPFFAMQRRSLNTFMNALTGQDFTCYPASSQVEKDFYNLLEVYLDAVFHPNLNPLSFQQEGCRLEFAVSDNPATPLEYKGIVFNEMKGALASPGARLGEIVNHHLYPDITYGFNSGGDPKHIPSLTYEELVDFHKKFYHPSRCLFYFYGNLPLEGHLDFILQQTLNEAQAADAIEPIPLQPRFLKPREVTEHYPIAPEESINDKTQIAFAWLTCHILEEEIVLALLIARIILMGTDAAPLKLALLKSGFCKEVSSFVDAEVSEPAFGIVARGCNPEDADKLEECLKASLTKILEEGIPQEAIESAIHQLEIAKSEITGDHSPFGLSLFMRSVLLKQHGGNAEEGLVIHAHFDKIRERVEKDPRYLCQLLEKYLLLNPHYVKIVLCPDPEMAAKELAEEKASLDRIRTHLSERQMQQIVDDARALNEFQKQQEEEDRECLPQVFISDVSRSPRVYPLKQESVGSLNVYHHDCFTNGIVYADCVFNLPLLTEKELPYISLFSSLMSQMGCGGRDYKSNLEHIIANVGGIGASLSFNLQVQDCALFSPSLSIRGKALHRKTPQLMQLIKDMVASIDFTDVDRLKEVILKYYTSQEAGLNQNAIRYAINLSASGLSIASKISNYWYGIRQFLMIRELAQQFDQQAEALVEKLTALKEKLLGIGTPDLILSCEEDIYNTMKNEGFYGLAEMQSKAYIPWSAQDYSLQPIAPQGRMIASPIAFTGKVFRTVPFIHELTPALSLSAFLCDNLTLHRKIREQGGAYGAGAVSNGLSGNYYFYAYRDPNIASTLKAFEESLQALAHGEFDEEDLQEAKLEMVQGLDAPIAPGSRGEVAYSWIREGKTYEVRSLYRERLLDATKDSIVRAVQEVLIPNMAQGIPVVFAGRDLLEKENQVLINEGRPGLEILSI